MSFHGIIVYLICMGASWLFLLVAATLYLRFRPWRSQRRGTQVFSRLFLTFWTVATLALTLETGFVLLFDSTDSFAQSNICRLWFLRHLQENPQGFRDARDFAQQLPPDRKRIVLLGDSFTYGHGIKNYQDRFGDILEQRWNNSTSIKAEVQNYAKPGMSMPDYIAQLEEFAADHVRIDLVILVYCLNDIETPDAPVAMVKVLNRGSGNFILRTTFLPNFLYLRLTTMRLPEVRDYFRWASAAYTGETWQDQQRRFDRVRELCRELHAPLLVVTFPFLHDLGSDYRFTNAHRVLAEYWQTNRVPNLDLLETMSEHSGEDLNISVIDAHPNERAHELAAEAIWKFIRSHQMELFGANLIHSR